MRHNFLCLLIIIISLPSSQLRGQDNNPAIITGVSHIKGEGYEKVFLSKMGNRTALNYTPEYESQVDKNNSFKIKVKENSPSLT